MNEFADDSNKSVIAMALFGKEGAKMLAYLEDLAVQQQVGAKYSQEQIDQSKTYELQLKQLTASGSAWKTELAQGMLPALQEGVQAMLGITNGSGGLRDEIKKLAADGSIAEWTRGAITGVSYVMDGFSYFKNLLQTAGIVAANFVAGFVDGLGTIGAIVAKVIKGEYKSAMDEAADWNDRALARDKLLDESMKTTWGDDTLGQRYRARVKDIQDTGTAMEVAKPKLDASVIHGTNTAAVKDRTDTEAKWIAGIESKIGVLQDSLDLGEKQTESNKIINQLYADMKNGILDLTYAQLENRLSEIDHLAAVEESVAADKELNKAIDEMVKAYDAQVATLEKGTAALVDAKAKQLDHNLEIKLGKEAFALLTVQRDLDTASSLDRQLQIELEKDGESGISAELRAQAQAWRDLAALKGEGIHVQAAHDAQVAWQKTTDSISHGLTDALMSSITNGKSLFVNFRNYLEDLFLKMVLAPTVNIVMGPIAGVINDLISSITKPLGDAISSALSISIKSAGSSVANAVTGSSGSSVLGTTAGSAAGSAAGSLTGTGGSALLSSGSAVGAAITGSMSVGNAAGSIAANVTGTGLDGLLATNGAFGTAAGATGASTTVAGSAAAGDSAMGSLAGAGPAALAVAAYFLLSGIDNSGPLIQGLAATEATFNGDGGLVRRSAARGFPSTSSTFYGAAAADAAYLQLAGDSATDQTFTYGEYLVNGVPKFDIWVNGKEMGLLDMDAASVARGVANAANVAMYGPNVGVNNGDGGGGFANGGDFGGGVRLVGERGPELELTGPSRIFNADQTASLLRSGGANNSEVVVELQLLRRALERSVINSDRTNKFLDKVIVPATTSGEIALTTRVVT